ncbi:MAG: ATP-binding protein, partial [Bacteroidetes bacterium]|nr:ATP-binding protein [Bacteroidota bacterium]
MLSDPTRVGKNYVACALAHKACLEYFKTCYFSLSRLPDTQQTARQENSYLKTLEQLAHTDVLEVDDWGLHRIHHLQRRDLMELLDDRYTVRSMISTSQYPLDKLYETIEDSTPADAIPNRFVNNAHKIELPGESIRNVKGQRELEHELASWPKSRSQDLLSRLSRIGYPSEYAFILIHKRDTRMPPRLKKSRKRIKKNLLQKYL